MVHTSGQFYCNIFIAISYCVLTVQLFQLFRNDKVLALFGGWQKNAKLRALYNTVAAQVALFMSFIGLCGCTHMLHSLEQVYPDCEDVRIAKMVLLYLCAIVSGLTAIASFKLFPIIAEATGKFELSNNGSFEHANAYMVEVVNLIQDSIAILSEDSTILRANEVTASLFGKDFLNRKVTSVVHPEDIVKFEDTILKVLNSYDSLPIIIEYRVMTDQVEIPSINTSTSGRSQRTVSSFVWVESTFCKGTRIDAGDHLEYDVKMLSRNIDHQKKEKLFKVYYNATKEKERINEAKMRYISCIAHDLKTPLQSFCFTVDLLSQTSMTSEQRELLGQANVAVDLMKLTISQTMDISKALSGAKLQPRRGPVHLSSIIERVSIIIVGYGKQVSVSYAVSDDIHDSIITDEEWLWQMLLNLLTNACKYTDKGSITVRVSLADMAAANTSSKPGGFISTRTPFRGANISDIVIATGPQQLLFEVLDTGVGILLEEIDHIFDAFAQVQEGQVTGTGLGLYGVRMRAEGLQGTCGARHNTESCTGTGTVTWFAIPYVMDCDAPAITPVSHNVPVSPLSEVRRKPGPKREPATSPDTCAALTELVKQRGLVAIVVDDTLTVRKLMSRLLMQLGFARVYDYENGSRGLDAMMAEPVDIVFSDVQMPIMTGPEMVSRFRKFETEALLSGQRQRRQLIVAVSANVTEFGANVSEGFDMICPKPFNRAELNKVVLHYLTSHEAAQA